jgi:hypothetical protein
MSTDDTERAAPRGESADSTQEATTARAGDTVSGSGGGNKQPPSNAHNPGRRNASTPLCGFRRQPGKRPCRNPAGLQTDHPGVGRCFMCGGRSEMDRTKAHKAIATAAMDTYGRPRQVGPHDALLEEVWRTAGHVAFLEQQIHAMEAAGLVAERPAGASPDAARAASEVSIWIKLYQSERSHLVSVCRTAIDCGIAERQVRIAEEQGRMIAGVISGVLGDLGIAADSDEVRLRVRQHLTLLASAPAPPPSLVAGTARRGGGERAN